MLMGELAWWLPEGRRMPATTPGQIHRLLEEAFNPGDLDGLMELYEPNAALIAQPGRHDDAPYRRRGHRARASARAEGKAPPRRQGLLGKSRKGSRQLGDEARNRSSLSPRRHRPTWWTCSTRSKAWQYLKVRVLVQPGVERSNRFRAAGEVDAGLAVPAPAAPAVLRGPAARAPPKNSPASAVSAIPGLF